MRRKAFNRAARIIPVVILTVLVLTASIGALAQDSMPRYLSGVINAYSPQSTNGTTTTGPYEIRGPWSLSLNAAGTLASFSAALNMGESDSWVLTQNPINLDPAVRGAHTHHIRLVGKVTQTATGFQVAGTAVVTLNGSPAAVLMCVFPISTLPLARQAPCISETSHFRA